MKNIITITTVLILILNVNSIKAQLQVRNDDFIQIGYEDHRTLSFGEETNSQNNGKYAIEHWDFGVGGMNFWKPWPTSNSGNFILWLRDDKNVAIGGYGSSSYKLKLYGSAFSTGSWIGSDRSLKKEVEDVKGMTSKLMDLKPKSYIYDFTLPKYYTGLENTDIEDIKNKTIQSDLNIEHTSGKTMGFIADELKEVFPELVQKDEEGFEAINYDGLIPVLVSALQEQQLRIANLENQTQARSSLENSFPSNDLKKDNSSLLHNSPNPFTEKTVITYYISAYDSGASQNQIFIFNQIGDLVMTIPISSVKGEHTLEIDLSTRSGGIYYYSLIIDNKNVDSKAMILSN